MKKTSPFQFKKFVIHHDCCSMKVGTDAVLLGSWVDVSHAKMILDIGTGSGVIALMLAQRTDDDVQIDALEIEQADASQAKENILRSPWAGKVSVFEKSLQEFELSKRYDLIVSNPPYFANSLLPPSTHRRRTRHTEHLTFAELITHSLRLLNSNGTLAVIIPVQEGNNFRQVASNNGLHVKRQLAFYSRKEKPQERWLFEFGFDSITPREERMILYESGDLKSIDYINLTKDFYL
jgi:tRNA1Val (adenine37-N6)-methyltransferase